MAIFGVVCTVIITVLLFLIFYAYVYARGLGMPSLFKRKKKYDY